MRLMNCQIPIELKLPIRESPLRKLVSLYFAYARATKQRPGQGEKQLSHDARHLTLRSWITAYLVRS